MTTLPLPIRKNIRDAEPKRDVHLVTLKTGSGLDFTVVSIGFWNKSNPSTI
jgi:hypothetical protein